MVHFIYHNLVETERERFMQFTRHGMRKENIMESMKPIEKADEFILRRLNCFFEYLLIRKPEVYYDFLSLLLKDTEDLILEDYTDFETYTIKDMIKDYSNLRNQIELASLQLRYYAQILGVNEAVFNKNEAIEVTLEQFTQSVVFAEYLWVSSLAKLIGKEEAGMMYRGAIERYILKYDSPNFTHFDTLEEMRDAFLKFIDLGALGRLRVSSNVENGVWILRCDNCEKVETLGDISHLDRDILHAVQCSADFQVTRLFNENFVMTRSQTIAKGDPYCDWVYHDIRYDKKLEHPSKEFMDNIMPFSGEKK